MLGGVVSAALLTGWLALFGGLAGGVPGALAGGLAGALLGGGYGWAVGAGRAYDLRTPRGVATLVVDLTWSLPNTAAGAVFLLVNLGCRNKLDRAFTAGRGMVGLHNGVFAGYATTIGPVQAGTGKGIDDPEAVHVLQARIFGPLYLALVLANYVLATVLPYWLLYHDRAARPITGLGTYLRRGVYPHTWHEEWAYRVQGTPPR